MTGENEVERVQFIIGPVRIYFVRLPDDDRDPAKMIVGTVLDGLHTKFLRGAWTVDLWEKWKLHPRWKQPTMLFIDATREAPGIRVSVAALVPARELPRELWGESQDGEEWRGEPDAEAIGTLPLGVLVRYESKFRYGNLMLETQDVLRRALNGKTMEPYEQGLAG